MSMTLQGQARTGSRGHSISVDPLQLVDTVIDGRYLIEAVVGAGGFGVIYRAKHIRFDSTIAVKVLLRDNTGAAPSPDSLTHGTDEGRLQFRLAALHPAIVRVFESGMVTCESGAQLPYIAMEWLEGLTLKAHVETLAKRGTSVPLPDAMALLDDLVQALSLAHVRRVAHRDLKPANVFLAWNDGKLGPKLLDFGLAKIGAESNDAYDDTLQQSSPFTPAYAAPEQWDRSMGATGPWTDVYSFALILTELLIGRRWFSDHAEPAFAALTLSPTRPTPRQLGALLDAEVDRVFLRALSVAPRERFATIQAFWEALASASGWVRPTKALCLDDYGIAVPSCEIGVSNGGTTGSGETLVVVDTEEPQPTLRPRSGTRSLRQSRASLSCFDSCTEVPASIQPSFLGPSGVHGAHASWRLPWRSVATLLVVAFVTGGILLATMRARREVVKSSDDVGISPRAAVSVQAALPREPDIKPKERALRDALVRDSASERLPVANEQSAATMDTTPKSHANDAPKAKPKPMRGGAPLVASSAQPSSVTLPSPTSLMMHDSLQTRK